MRVMQNFLEAELQNMPKKVLAQMIRQKVADMGGTISERASVRLADAVAEGKATTIDGWKFWKKHYEIEFSDDDLELLEQGVSRIVGQITELLDDASDSATDTLLRDRSSFLRTLASARKDRRDFEKRLAVRWGDGLTKLEILLGLSCELGQDFATEVLPDLTKTQPFLGSVLLHSQARACQIAGAIIALMQHGFADDAMARWRSLHEIGVTLTLLTEHGEGLAERYVLHQHIDAARDAGEYKNTEAWGYEPIDPAMLEQIAYKKEEMRARFGEPFLRKYGWATDHLKKANTFRDIEEEAGKSAWRATYGMTSHAVHASAKSAYFRLSLLDSNDIALSGPSNAGFADPGHATALGLLNVNMCLFPFFNTLDSHVFAKVMLKLADEIGDDLLAAQRQLEADEARFRAHRPTQKI